MFTGLVEAQAEVRAVEHRVAERLIDVRLALPADWFSELALGDSVAVAGCCLTVAQISDDAATFALSMETARVSRLADLAVGAPVNVERALRWSARLGGHVVSGHVDGCVEVLDVRASGEAREVWLSVLPQQRHLVVPKGSICLDGVSLTINEVRDQGEKTQVSVMLIPVTLASTTLKSWGAGSRVNVEYDLFGKYVERARAVL